MDYDGMLLTKGYTQQMGALRDSNLPGYNHKWVPQKLRKEENLTQMYYFGTATERSNDALQAKLYSDGLIFNRFSWKKVYLLDYAIRKIWIRQTPVAILNWNDSD